MYVNSDFAGNTIDRSSTTGILVKVYGNVVHWCVRKENTMATSLAETGYIAFSTAGKYACSWRNLLQSVDCDVENPMFCDSAAAISIL